VVDTRPNIGINCGQWQKAPYQVHLTWGNTDLIPKAASKQGPYQVHVTWGNYQPLYQRQQARTLPSSSDLRSCQPCLKGSYEDPTKFMWPEVIPTLCQIYTCLRPGKLTSLLTQDQPSCYESSKKSTQIALTKAATIFSKKEAHPYTRTMVVLKKSDKKPTYLLTCTFFFFLGLSYLHKHPCALFGRRWCWSHFLK
jgi:hypothetical protein